MRNGKKLIPVSSEAGEERISVGDRLTGETEARTWCGDDVVASSDTIDINIADGNIDATGECRIVGEEAKEFRTVVVLGGKDSSTSEIGRVSAIWRNGCGFFVSQLAGIRIPQAAAFSVGGVATDGGVGDGGNDCDFIGAIGGFGDQFADRCGHTSPGFKCLDGRTKKVRSFGRHGWAPALDGDFCCCGSHTPIPDPPSPTRQDRAWFSLICQVNSDRPVSEA